MTKKNFDLDKYLDELDDDFIESPTLGSRKSKVIKKKASKCPRCGAKKWDFMRYSAKGQVLFCSECRHVNNQ